LAAVDWQKALPLQFEKLLSRQDEAVRAAVESLMTGFIKTDWPARFQGAERTMAEAPFSLELEDVHLYGRIDMLFQEDGGWVVVDYKTGALERGRGYEHQVRLYALAVAGALQEIPAQVALVAVGDGKDFVEEVDPRALKEMEDLLRETARGIRSGQFACRTGDWCADCGYQGGLCTSGATAR
jgi:RecB family exonuclease